MKREGVVDILKKLQSDIPPGLHRYKLIEQLRHVWSPRSGRRHRSVYSRIRARVRHGKQDELVSVHRHCCGCGYALDGLDPAFGDELPVGPDHCPECGTDYPAVW